MIISLNNRTEETVRIYFSRTRDMEIQKALPQKAQTLEEAVRDYRKTLEAGSKSYGRTIYADGNYVGDIWCYCIHENINPQAMISYCIFEKKYWSRGIATAALKVFLQEIIKIYNLRNIGAFTYSYNIGSIKVLDNCGFKLVETFGEEGIESKYFIYQR